EVSRDVVFDDPKADRFQLDVCVVPSEHFEVVGDALGELTIVRDEERAEAKPFELRVVDGAADVAGAPAPTGPRLFPWRAPGGGGRAAWCASSTSRAPSGPTTEPSSRARSGCTRTRRIPTSP